MLPSSHLLFPFYLPSCFPPPSPAPFSISLLLSGSFPSISSYFLPHFILPLQLCLLHPPFYPFSLLSRPASPSSSCTLFSHLLFELLAVKSPQQQLQACRITLHHQVFSSFGLSQLANEFFVFLSALFFFVLFLSFHLRSWSEVFALYKMCKFASLHSDKLDGSTWKQDVEVG